MVQRDDLAVLPAGVRAAAPIYDNGEISWPIADAQGAKDALADAGFLILGS
jgi:hypothetical protein